MKTTFLVVTAFSLISLSVICASKNTPASAPIKNVEEPMKEQPIEEKKPTFFVQDLTPETAESIIANLPLVVVDFYAEWCGPCKTLKPVFEQVAQELGNKYVFAKVNIDNCKDIATKYNVSSIPTIIIFSKGQVLGKVTGLVSKETLLEKIEIATKGPQDLSKLSKADLNEKLWQATYTMESVDEIKRFIDAGADVNYAKNGATPILMVIMNCGMRGMDAAPYLKLLLDAGASTEIADPAGNKSELSVAATQMGDNMRAMAKNYDKMAEVIKEHKEKSVKAAAKKCDGNVCQL